jgi:phosphate transport system substrate-binding protein
MLVLAALSLVAACGDSGKTGARDSSGAPSSSASGSGANLTGAGSSFAYPLYSKWASEYQAKTGVRVNYQSIGSGGGIRQFSEQVVDFGGTDGPMTDEQIARAKGGTVLHIPTAMGAVAITYNLPALKAPLRVDGPTLADIFRGVVTRWNDARLAALNPGVALPAEDILVVHRSDGAGTTYAFTDYLSAVSPAWKSGTGKGTDVKWPVGLGGKGSEGVTGQVKQTPGTIGYVELSYATQNRLPTAVVKNAEGEFVAPSPAAVTAAAAGAAAKLPATTDYRISIVNAPGKGAYPISSFTWILAYAKNADQAKGKLLRDFLHWGLTDGQSYETALDYAPLPEAMRAALVARVDSIQ